MNRVERFCSFIKITLSNTNDHHLVMKVHPLLVFYHRHSAYNDDDRGIHVHKIINKLKMNIAQDYFLKQAKQKIF
jgi:hypothetical protein